MAKPEVISGHTIGRVLVGVRQGTEGAYMWLSPESALRYAQEVALQARCADAQVREEADLGIECLEQLLQKE